jgi:hypothetical protein
MCPPYFSRNGLLRMVVLILLLAFLAIWALKSSPVTLSQSTALLNFESPQVPSTHNAVT